MAKRGTVMEERQQRERGPSSPSGGDRPETEPSNGFKLGYVRALRACVQVQQPEASKPWPVFSPIPTMPVPKHCGRARGFAPPAVAIAPLGLAVTSQRFDSDLRKARTRLID